jgi:hypothetical protein
MRRPILLTLPLALGVASALALASCGGDDAKLLPGATAQEITENLDTVKQLANEHECAGAASATEEVSDQVEALGELDPKLKRALERGVARLGEVVATCEEATEEAVAPSTEAPTTTERTAPPEQKKKPQREREAGTRGKQEEATQPTTPTTPEAPSGEEGGGTGAPGGLSPAEPASPEGE